MKYWVIGGGIVGMLVARSGDRFTGMIVGMIVGAAISTTDSLCMALKTFCNTKTRGYHNNTIRKEI